MSELKCPVCKKELRPLAIGWCCDCGMCGDKELWQELITTKKALDVANAVIMDYAKEKLEKKEEK